MPDVIPPDSVGIVIPQKLTVDTPLKLVCGKTLSSYEIVYETYGELNRDRTNAVLICHALSGHHHAAGYHSPDDKKPGWWDVCIGPGKAIDTNRFFVVRSEEHTSELQSRPHLVCRLLLEKKKKKKKQQK